MLKDMDFTERIIPLFVIVMIGWVLVFSMLWYFLGSLHQGRLQAQRNLS